MIKVGIIKATEEDLAHWRKVDEWENSAEGKKEREEAWLKMIKEQKEDEAS